MPNMVFFLLCRVICPCMEVARSQKVPRMGRLGMTSVSVFCPCRGGTVSEGTPCGPPWDDAGRRRDKGSWSWDFINTSYSCGC